MTTTYNVDSGPTFGKIFLQPSDNPLFNGNPKISQVGNEALKSDNNDQGQSPNLSGISVEQFISDVFNPTPNPTSPRSNTPASVTTDDTPAPTTAADKLAGTVDNLINRVSGVFSGTPEKVEESSLITTAVDGVESFFGLPFKICRMGFNLLPPGLQLCIIGGSILMIWKTFKSDKHVFENHHHITIQQLPAHPLKPEDIAMVVKLGQEQRKRKKRKAKATVNSAPDAPVPAPTAVTATPKPTTNPLAGGTDPAAAPAVVTTTPKPTTNPLAGGTDPAAAAGDPAPDMVPSAPVKLPNILKIDKKRLGKLLKDHSGPVNKKRLAKVFEGYSGPVNKDLLAKIFKDHSETMDKKVLARLSELKLKLDTELANTPASASAAA